MATLRRSFTDEFKEEAVRLGEARGFPAAGRALDVGVNLIRRWKKQIEESGTRPFPGKGNAKDEELAALHKRLRRSEEEVAILKKAVGIFTHRPR
jgi:transposase